MASIKVTSESLHSTSTQLASGASSIEGELARLKGQVDSLVGGGWSGSASDSFNGLYTQWNTSSQQLKEALAGISKALQTSAVNYEQAESTNVSNFSG